MPTPDDFPKSSSGLLTVKDSGAAPKARIDDFICALNIVETLRKASEPRNAKAARIAGQINGNPPFNPAKQQQAGMKGYPNFNTLEAKAYLSAALVPYYDLFSSAPNHVEVTLDQKDGRLRDEWSRIDTEELHRTLTESTWFELQMWKMLHDFVGFGKGFLIWPDTVTHRFKRVSWHRVLFPDETDVDPQEWESFAVIWHYNAHDLYKRVRNKERAESMGWNVDATIKAIQLAARYDPANVNDWLGVQQKLRDQDLDADNNCERIVTAWLFVKEFDGRWSWMIVPILGLMDPLEKKFKKEQHGFLFSHIGIYENIHQIIAPFFFEVFDGSVNGLAGLGKDIFAPMQLKDRMACAKVNNVFLRSSVLMQAKSATARQKAALVQIGNVTLIPEGYDVQQATILGDIESTIAVGRDIDLMLQSNTGIYRPQFEKPQGNPETATAATLRFQQGTILGNSAVNRFHRQLDGAYQELYRRIVKSGEAEAEKFRKWCEDRGVPREALAKTRCVRSYRNVGNGSAFLRQTNIGSLAAFFPEFPEDGKQAFLEDVVAAYTGQTKVERFVKTAQQSKLPTEQGWAATIENDSLSKGSPVLWTPQQSDSEHLQIHATALQQALQGVQQGGDPAAIAVFGHALIAHAAVHINALQRKGRKKEVQQWTNIFKQLGQTVEELSQQVQQQQQEQAQRQQRQEQVMSDQQLKQLEASGKMQLASMKAQHGMDIKSRKAELDMAISRAKTMQDLTLSDLQTAAEIKRADMTGSNGNGE